MKLLSILKVRKIFYIPVLLSLIFSYSVAAFSSNIYIYHVYKILPTLVVYTDKMDQTMSGTCIGIISFIHTDFHGNKIILNHELTHVKQIYRSGFLYWVPLLFSEKKLVQMEAEAYTTEILLEKDIRGWGKIIKKEYNFYTSPEEIEDYIRYYWKEK
jgi:hypothetical protein